MNLFKIVESGCLRDLKWKSVEILTFPSRLSSFFCFLVLIACIILFKEDHHRPQALATVWGLPPGPGMIHISSGEKNHKRGKTVFLGLY